MGDYIQEQDCAVCLQKCHHPTRLPCGHVFCFLCVKGVAIQNRKCAMCRAEIPRDYLDNPVLLEKLSPHQSNEEEPQIENQWYYEGRNGWWKYDERSNVELETAFGSGDGECTLMLAGAVYSIDFQSMTQVRCSDQTRRRRVRRDTPLFPAKGVAGIKADDTLHIAQTKENDVNLNVPSEQNEGDAIEIIDDDDNEEDAIEIIDEDDDDEVIILSTEPVIISVDDVSDEFDRLNIVNAQDPQS